VSYRFVVWYINITNTILHIFHLPVLGFFHS
jgi:hypothetical protein